MKYRLVVVGLLALALAASIASAQQDIRLMLPKTVYAVPGIECNLYFDNTVLVLNAANFAFDIDCARGRQFADCWRFVPTAEEVGDYGLTLTVRNADHAVVAEGTTVLRVAPANAGAGRKVSLLLIGDSLTNASVYSQHLLDLCAGEGNPSLTLVGSHGRGEPLGPNRHEGYGGWTAKRFATLWTGIARTGDAAKRGSPFLYETDDGQRVLDFQRYCNDVHGGQLPDAVTIFLGCNDTFSAIDDSIDGVIDDMFAHMDALIAMIRAVSSELPIGLIQPVPPTVSQDAFGANYASGQTRWQYRRNQHRVVERMEAHYADQPRIWLVPAYVNLDCAHNFPMASQPVNARNEAAIVRQYDSVHPAESGYRQIGDSVYCWLKTLLAQDAQALETAP
ncbi:MAG: SGNH/GDSL hydrolase family protein [Candidatus Hydrogenedentales bacterium]|jgi:lysophospholipase L1-like esterase